MNWQPSADLEALRQRARLLQSIRAFFHHNKVLEVTTPLVSRAANTDPHIDSLSVKSSLADDLHYLHTSPELAMKRLLAAGVGDCYQVCPVFRDGESGRYHNPEFTMLEWYRLGFSMLDLVEEVEKLIQSQAVESVLTVRRYSYQELFLDYCQMDVIESTQRAVNQKLIAEGLWEDSQEELEKDAALDLLFSQYIATQFPDQQITSIYHYPASQASLARLSPDDPRVAERFEVYWGATELANGFHELANGEEQLKRFEEDNLQRRHADKPEVPIDQYFIESLNHDFPDCSGVALGIDRLLMKILGKSHIKDVVSFDWGRI